MFGEPPGRLRKGGLPVVRPRRQLGWRQHLADWIWPFPKHSVSVDTLLREARTGDVLLWESGGLWVKWWTWSSWTHVSLVYRNPETGRLCQWQSTTHVGCTDLLTGEFDRRGVQLNDLGDSVRIYLRQYGRVAWCPLLMRDEAGAWVRPPVGQAESARVLNDGFASSMNRTCSMTFRPGWPMMGGRDPFLQFCPGPLGYSTSFDAGMYCAVHSAYTLQLAGVLDDHWPSWNYSPASFDPRCSQLNFAPGYGYGQIQQVVL